MFDFRYHALSLVAVFLALGIGILLGVTIGDSLVSQADRGLREDLAADVREARRERDEARRGLEGRDRLIEAVFPQLVSGQLSGRRVAVVAAGGGLPEGVESGVREAVEVAGGRVDSVSTLDDPVAMGKVAEAIGTPVEGTVPDGEVLGSRLGRLVVRGGGAARQLEEDFSDVFRGDYRGAEAVVFFRSPPEEADEERQDEEDKLRRESARALEDSLLDAIGQEDIPAVGVEESDTDPSRVPFYKDRGLTSVDSVDLFAGRVALVSTLDGAEGNFGFKDTADEPLPELPRLSE